MKHPKGGSHNEDNQNKPDDAQSGTEHQPSHDSSVQDALNAFCRKGEQSYEDFLQGFTHLTHADIQRQMLRQMIPQPSNPERASGSSTSKSTAPRSACEVKVMKDVSDSTEIEEEVLEDSKPLSSNTVAGKKLLQVDNFLLYNSDDDSDTEVAGGYTASFSSNVPNKLSESAQSEPIDSKTTTYCSESGQNNPYIDVITGKCGNSDSNFKNTSVKEVQTKSDLSTVDCDNSDEDNDGIVSEVISQQNRVQNMPSDLKCTSHSTQHHVTNQVETDEEMECEVDVHAELPDLSSLPNPGEIEEEPEITPNTCEIQTNTLLDFAVLPSKIDKESHNTAVDEQEPDSGGRDECVNDDVVPFTLDDDFDYDNVSLTPKFTPSEMTYLNSFRPSPL